jgi:hypothetical protein
VYDNKWVNYSDIIFKVRDYISSVVRGTRTRFFKDRNHAVYLLIGIDPNEGVKAIEGTHVPYTTVKAVPPPAQYDMLPIIGIVLIQDGSRDLTFGFRPLKDENIVYMSGMGNVVDKDLKGIAGEDSTIYGETGLIGITGFLGYLGITGVDGPTGYAGFSPPPEQGSTGLQGMTGINWNIHIPFEEFF